MKTLNGNECPERGQLSLANQCNQALGAIKASNSGMVARMLQVLIIIMLTTTKAWAWEFTSGSLCTLVHDDRDAAVRVTYDPSKQIYAISITSSDPWRNGPVFALRFNGQRSNTISTSRHIVSDDSATLTVTDSGFGNVLDGLEFNQTATAVLGDQAVTFGLNNAAPAVREFRVCASGVRV